MKLLEMCCYDIESTLITYSAGADRIERCSARQKGGLTSCCAVITEAVRITKVPVFSMFRPQGVDFYYTAGELSIMKQEVKIQKRLSISRCGVWHC